MIQAFAFYLFAAVVLTAGAMTIASRNPVHSVLWLILAFFNAAGLMVLAGAEFIAMLLVIVYVGAVAVLFLFVVMMLDIDFAELRAGFARRTCRSASRWRWSFAGGGADLRASVRGPCWRHRPEQHARSTPAARWCQQYAKPLALLLYSQIHFPVRDWRAFVLLVAMIGAIVLTQPQARRSAKAQDRLPPGQTARRPEDAVRLVDAAVGLKSCKAVVGNYDRHRTFPGGLVPYCSCIGVLGIFLNRKNVIIILMAIELILLAVNINLVAFSPAFWATWWGRFSRCSYLRWLRARLPSASPFSSYIFAARGTIAVDDVNRMKRVRSRAVSMLDVFGGVKA